MSSLWHQQRAYRRTQGPRTKRPQRIILMKMSSLWHQQRACRRTQGPRRKRPQRIIVMKMSSLSRRGTQGLHGLLRALRKGRRRRIPGMKMTILLLQQSVGPNHRRHAAQMAFRLPWNRRKKHRRLRQYPPDPLAAPHNSIQESLRDTAQSKSR